MKFCTYVKRISDSKLYWKVMGYLGKLNQMVSLVQKTIVIKRSLSLLIKKLLFLDACSGEETMFIQSAGNQQKEGLAIPPPVVMSGTKVYVISLK